MSDLSAARSHAERAAIAVSSRLLEGFDKSDEILRKSDHASDTMSVFDEEIEARLFEHLKTLDPSIGFYGEETGATGGSETFWLVDPIDGTTHFLRGMPFCTTMIALIDAGEVLLSVINEFVAGRTFSAAKGAGATCNGSPIRVADRSLKHAYLSVEMNVEVPGNARTLERIHRATTPFASIAAGWDFAMTAMGKLDGRVMKNPWGGVWDVAPGALLVAEAGGRVANVGTRTYDYRNLDFLAVAPSIFEELTTGEDPIFPID